MTEFMGIHVSEIKNHVNGRKEQGQNLAWYFTLQKYFKDNTQISLKKKGNVLVTQVTIVLFLSQLSDYRKQI